MAIGDKALAAGMPLVSSSSPARTLADEDNRTRDMIAERTNLVQPIAKGGTGAETAAAARANLGITIGTADRAEPGRLAVYNAAAQLTTADPTLGGHAASKQYVDGRVSSIATPDVSALREGHLSSNIYNRGTSGQWRALAVQSDGTLAHTASAARLKENVQPLEVSDEQLRALQLVEFDWIESGFHDVGLLADTVADAGLEQFVFYDDDGRVLGIHYERVALTLLPVVQRLLGRVAALEEDRAHD